MLVFGGGGDGTYFNDLWRYNYENLEWRAVDVEGHEPEPRAYHTAVHVGQRLFIFGGWKGDEFINDLSVLETGSEEGGDVTFRWTHDVKAIGVPPGPRAYHTAVEIDNKVVVFGGWGAQDFCADVSVLSVVEGKQPAWETLSSAGETPKARAAHTCTRIGDLLYVFGGESSDGRLNDVAVLDMNTRLWTFPNCSGPPPTARSGHSATSVGRWLVVYGGWDGDQHLVDMHMLDTVEMRWVSARPPVPKDESVPNTLEGRSGYASALVGGDKLLVTGGWDRENFLADVVVLDLAGLTQPDWSGTLNRGASLSETANLTETRLPPGSPAWLKDLVAAVAPENRLARVEGLPEWQTFIAQAPKIVEGVDKNMKEDTIVSIWIFLWLSDNTHPRLDTPKRLTTVSYFFQLCLRTGIYANHSFIVHKDYSKSGFC